MTFLRAAFVLAAATTPQALAQIQPVIRESFDYPVPALLINQAGGSGFATAWDILPNGDDLVMFDSTNSTFALADTVGGYAGQAREFGSAFREIDVTQHPDIQDAGRIGADGSTVWISFSSIGFQVLGQHYGGLSLFDGLQTEVLFIGSPFGTFQWGIDSQEPNGAGVSRVPGTTSQVGVRMVTRIDFLPGNERVRVWVNPSSPFPTDAAAIDRSMPDIRFDTIRLSSGGSNSLYFWDDIRIDKGDGSIGTNYCSTTPNSAGLNGVISAIGSLAVADNNVTLTASNVPPAQFGIFIVSATQGFVPGVNGSSNGNLCLAGAIGRYLGPGGSFIQPTGSGTFSLAIDLAQVPQGGGSTATTPGQTWNFQAWHRDGVGLGSNLTDGLQVTFQ